MMFNHHIWVKQKFCYFNLIFYLKKSMYVFYTNSSCRCDTGSWCTYQHALCERWGPQTSLPLYNSSEFQLQTTRNKVPQSEAAFDRISMDSNGLNYFQFILLHISTKTDIFKFLWQQLFEAKLSKLSLIKGCSLFHIYMLTLHTRLHLSFKILCCCVETCCPHCAF